MKVLSTAPLPFNHLECLLAPVSSNFVRFNRSHPTFVGKSDSHLSSTFFPTFNLVNSRPVRNLEFEDSSKYILKKFRTSRRVGQIPYRIPLHVVSQNLKFRCTKNVSIPYNEILELPIASYFEATTRIVAVVFPDAKRLRYLGDDTWRVRLRPVTFFGVSATPVCVIKAYDQSGKLFMFSDSLNLEMSGAGGSNIGAYDLKIYLSGYLGNIEGNQSNNDDDNINNKNNKNNISRMRSLKATAVRTNWSESEENKSKHILNDRSIVSQGSSSAQINSSKGKILGEKQRKAQSGTLSNSLGGAQAGTVSVGQNKNQQEKPWNGRIQTAGDLRAVQVSTSSPLPIPNSFPSRSLSFSSVRRSWLQGEVELSLSVSPPPPISLMPDFAIIPVGDAILDTILSAMQSALLNGLVKDYTLWCQEQSRKQ